MNTSKRRERALRNWPPIDSTCSWTTGRTSYPRTTAPMFFAVWMAARPATPAPSTKTRAGASLPAAVMLPAIVRPYACAASMTARKPARFACELRASKAWPLESKRGMQSIANTVEP